MLNIKNENPGVCHICGCYFTIVNEYCGHRCLDPGHWQAAGLLAPDDFYPMALIAAQSNAELSFRARQNLSRY